MRLQDCMAEYVECIKHERRLAKTTCKHYASWLNGFLRWLDANGSPEPDLDVFNTLTLRRYQMDKAKEGARPRTIYSAFHPLIGFGEFAVERGYLPANPCKELKMPKRDAAVRHTLTDADVRALFEACGRQRTRRQAALYRGVLAVLAYGGLRRFECCDLKIDDVSLSEKSILVRAGKGSKSRRLFVCREAVNALREWLMIREPDCQGDWLFMIDRKRRLHFRGIQTLMETLAASAGMADNPACKPHSLRHWCLSNLVRRGAGLRDVMEFSGHADIQTLNRYLHSGEEQLRSIAELTSMKPTEEREEGKIISLFHVRERPHDRLKRRRISR